MTASYAEPIVTTIDIFEGATFAPPAWVWLVDGAPVDMTGATALMRFRLDPFDESTPLADITTTPGADGAITLGATDGTIAPSVAPVATTAIVAGAPRLQGYFYVQVTLADASVHIPVYGTFITHKAS